MWHNLLLDIRIQRRLPRCQTGFFNDRMSYRILDSKNTGCDNLIQENARITVKSLDTSLSVSYGQDLWLSGQESQLYESLFTISSTILHVRNEAEQDWFETDLSSCL